MNEQRISRLYHLYNERLEIEGKIKSIINEDRVSVVGITLTDEESSILAQIVYAMMNTRIVKIEKEIKQLNENLD